MAAVAIPPPPRSGSISIIQQQQQTPWKSNAVNRSNEFLSCTRTALKIAQQQYHNQQHQDNGGSNNNSNTVQLPEWMINITPNELNLYQHPATPYNEHSEDDDDTISLIQDSQTLLNLLDTHLSELNVLVRRRGHTNDPTLEIQSIMEKFQEGAKEIKDVCDLLRLSGTKPFSNSIYNEYKRSSSQRRKHYELLSQQLESQAKERTDQIKKELETRSKVLRDQTQRRKLLATGVGVGVGAPTSSNGVVANGSTANRVMMNQPTITTRLPTQKRAVNTSSQFQSPLFTTTQPGVGGVGVAAAARKITSSTATKTGYSGYAGYGGAQAPTSNGVGASRGYAGYGGTTSAPPSFATGMRQRKGGDQQSQQPKSHIQIDNGSNEDNDYEDKYNKNGESSIQAQILQRRTNRATKNRAAQARLAEKSIAELGVMFTKMSSLISQQGEVLERIEDDVEAAGLDIDAGHDELVKVYGMTKGNRGLIIKIFGILIFLIIFMKLYER